MRQKERDIVAWSLAILLLVGCMVSDIDARKTSSNTRRTSSKTNTGRVQKPTTHQETPSKYGNTELTKLSYPSQNANPPLKTQQHQPAAQPVPSAPVLPHSPNTNQATQQRPVGWNVPSDNGGIQKQTVQHTNAAPPYPVNNPPYPVNNPPYPVSGGIQKQTVSNTNAAPPYPHQQPNAPPAYSPTNNAGPPPAYSPYGNNNARINDAPPPYSPHAGAAQYPGNG